MRRASSGSRTDRDASDGIAGYGTLIFNTQDGIMAFYAPEFSKTLVIILNTQYSILKMT